MSKQRTRARKPGGSRPADPSRGKETPRGKETAAQAAKRQLKRETRRQRPAKKSRGHTGWAGMRRTRRQKLGIAAVALGAIALIWIFADWQLAIGLTALVLVALPAVVVLTMGRRY